MTTALNTTQNLDHNDPQLRSDVAVASSAAHSGGAVALTTQYAHLASNPLPPFVLGSLAPGGMDIPFRTANWGFEHDDLTKPWQIDVASHSNVKSLLLNFGFVYWKELFLEVYHMPVDFHATISAIGGFTFHRPTTPSKAVIQALPTSSTYDFPPGVAVRIQCPFGGLVSPLLSHAPLIGSRASFVMTCSTANTHPYVPTFIVKDKQIVGAELRQPPLPGQHKDSNGKLIKVQILKMRLHGTLHVSQPLPGLAGLV